MPQGTYIRSEEENRRMSQRCQRPITYKIDKNTCHICTSHKPSKRGYIRVRRQGKSPIQLIRIIYENNFGYLKEGEIVRHKCDVPMCINPEYLERGFPADNSRDMVKRGRSLKGNKHPRSIVTKEIAKEIVNCKMTQIKVSKKYGISQSIISLIKLGKHWIQNNKKVD